MYITQQFLKNQRCDILYNSRQTPKHLAGHSKNLSQRRKIRADPQKPGRTRKISDKIQEIVCYSVCFGATLKLPIAELKFTVVNYVN